MRIRESSNPAGPKAIPGTYKVRLTVDGKAQEQPLKIVMDPRSPATAEALAQQLQLGRKIFGEIITARRAQAEIASVQKQLREVRKQPAAQSSSLAPALDEALAGIERILTNKGGADAHPGLQDAYTALTSALRVVDSGDRAVPSQAVAVFNESSQQVKARIAEWEQFKQTNLAPLNQKMRDSNIAPIKIADIEQQAEAEGTRQN